MPGRNYLAGMGYRYGYQGSETEKEINLNTYTTFYREMDTRLGRMWSVDPKTKTSESPFVMMSNNPIWFNDILGDTIRKNSYMGDKYMGGSFKEPTSGFIFQQLSKTKQGRSLLGEFALKGDRIGNQIIKKDGKYSKFNLEFNEVEFLGIAEATTSMNFRNGKNGDWKMIQSVNDQEKEEIGQKKGSLILTINFQARPLNKKGMAGFAVTLGH